MNDKENKAFIIEKVDKSAILKRRIFKISILLISAVIFGSISAITFLFVKDIYENRIDKKIKEEIKQISVAIDEAESKENSTVTESTELFVVEDIVQTALEEYKFDLVSLDTMYKSFSELAFSLDYSIVSVYNKNKKFDWFENEFEISNKLAGVVIAKSDIEYFILVPSKGIEKDGEISLIFKDDKEYVANIKAIDKYLGIAILSINKNDLENTTKEIIKEVKFGNSNKLKTGDIVLGLGAPIGKVHSMVYTSINYIDMNISFADMNSKLIYTDIYGKENMGNYIFNTSGEFVAFVNGEENNKFTAFGISDFKFLIEAMINSEKLVYLGVEAKDIERNIENLGIEKGVYIKKVIENSPAYIAGLQRGDILTHINGINIKSMVEYKNTLNNISVDDNVNIKLKRYALGEYVDLEFNLVAQAR